jgi:hypothetical protein
MENKKEQAPTLDEAAVRALRNKAYDQETTDNNWEHCKEHWMQPDEVKWLQEHAA